jgi:hypothetical protein
VATVSRPARRDGSGSTRDGISVVAVVAPFSNRDRRALLALCAILRYPSTPMTRLAMGILLEFRDVRSECGASILDAPSALRAHAARAGGS